MIVRATTRILGFPLCRNASGWGSKTGSGPLEWKFRSTPGRGHRQAVAAFPFRANSGSRGRGAREVGQTAGSTSRASGLFKKYWGALQERNARSNRLPWTT